MKRQAAPENRAWVLALSLMSVLGICLVGVMVASVGWLFLHMNGLQPVPLHSPLHANYSADPRSIRFPILNLSVVEEAIHDQATSSVDSQEQLSTVVVVLETPIPTLTPYFTQAAPASPEPSATSKPPGITPSAIPTLTPTQTTTHTPTVTLTLKVTSTVTLGPGKPTLTATPTPKSTVTVTITPTKPAWITPTPTKTVWISPTPTKTVWISPTSTSTSTLIPSETPTRTPTATVVPTFTPTNTKLPTFTPTPTPMPYPPPPTSYP